jgi:2'-hydroxyisoflavone reductase
MGGTLFLGRHIVEAALKRGHEVTLFNRGLGNRALFPATERLTGDRNTNLAALAGRRFDAVIDPSAYQPEHIDSLLAALHEPPAHYTLISTISVYGTFPPGRRFDERTPVVAGHEGYGALKARAEEAVQTAMPRRVAVLRPGLIVGPHDPTGRFTYWPRRIDAGGLVLAPGCRERQIQFIDARDLAEWSVRMAEDRVEGVYNAVGPRAPLTMGRFLDACVDIAESGARLAWIPDDEVLAAGIEGWTELPLWIAEDDAEAGGIFQADHHRAIEQGLAFRPLAQTIRHTLQWCRETGDVPDSPLRARTLGAANERDTLARLLRR